MLAAGCTGPIPKKEDVKGKWVAVEKENYTLGGGQAVGFTIEFYDDDNVMLPSGKGTWIIEKNGTIKIETPAITMHGSIKKDKLTITLPDEKGKVIFKKVQMG